MSSESTASNRSTHLFVDPSAGIQLSISGHTDVLEGQNAQVKAINLLVRHMNAKAQCSDNAEASQKGYLSVLDEIGRALKREMDVFPKEQRNIEVVRNFLSAILLSRVYEKESYQGILDQDRTDDGEDGEQPIFALRR